MKKYVSLLLTMVLGGMLGITLTEKKNNKCIMKGLLTSNRNLMSFRVMNQWVKVKQQGKICQSILNWPVMKKLRFTGWDIWERLCSVS